MASSESSESNVTEYHVGEKDKQRHPTEEQFVKLAKAKPSAKMRKTEEAFARNEIKKMMLTDAQSGMALLEDRPPEAPGGPPTQPKFEMGQSIHHFWAGWMPDCTEEDRPLQVKGKQRPKWYSGQLTSPGEWMTTFYGGCKYEGWHYRAY